MKHTKILFSLGLVVVFLFSFAFAEQIGKTTSDLKEKSMEKTEDLSPGSPQSQNPEKSPQTSRLPERVLIPEKSPSPANYILVTDVLDSFGGVKYGGGCDLSYFAGGQSSPVGDGSSTSFKLYAGFVYPTVVLCGDVNKSGLVELLDLVFLIAYLYRGGPAPDPAQAADVNCDGDVALGDVVYLISYLYRGGADPVC